MLGCGFVEFYKEEHCEKAATLNGKNLLGRPIRIDWSD
jgi:RNA recognition motif-containing protein